MFGFDSAEWSGDGKPVSDEHIQGLRGQAGLTSAMRSDGHADSTGSRACHKNLLRHRAQAVVDYTLSRSDNVKASDMEVGGMNESGPVASNAMRAGRTENRGVVICADGCQGRGQSIHVPS